jgi:hypothetical protein
LRPRIPRLAPIGQVINLTPGKRRSFTGLSTIHLVPIYLI